MVSKTHGAERRLAFRALYDAEWSDQAIARVLKASPTTVERWRNDEGLAPHFSVYSQKIDHDAALVMYHDGASDGEIARHFNATQSGVTRWRQRVGLEPNFAGLQPFDGDTRRRARRMLCRGAARFQVAEEFGVGAHSTISRWRRKISDPGLRRPGLTNISIRRQVLRDATIHGRIVKALGKALPGEVREEATIAMYTDVLDGRLLVGLIEREAPSYRSAAFSICGSNYGPRSLDEENEDGWALGSTIQDPTALEAFDDIFEDRWN